MTDTDHTTRTTMTTTTDDRSGRLFLRGDALFLQHRQGAVVKDRGGSYLVRGEGAYTWLTTLAPHLDGRRSSAAIVGELPDALRDTAAGLLRLLTDKGTVVPLDSTPDIGDHEPLTATESFLANWTSAPRAAAARFRDAHVAVVGEDDACAVVARTLRDNGADRVVSCGSVADVPDDAQWVVASSASTSVAALRELAARAATGAITLLPVLALDDKVLFGPVVREETADALDAVLDGVTRNGEARVGADLWRSAATGGPVGAAVPGAVLGLVGVQVAFELFRAVTQVEPTELDDRCCVVDVPSLDMRLEPLVRVAAAAAAPVPTAVSRDDRPREEVLDGLLATIGQTVGLVSALDDDDVPQHPLFAARVRHGWSHPLVADGRRGVSRRDLLEARLDALLGAFAAMSARVAGLPGTSPGGTVTAVAAGAGAAEATERATWRALAEVQLQRALRGSPAARPVAPPHDPVTVLLIRSLTDSGHVPAVYLWTDAPAPTVLGVLTDEKGAVAHWTLAAGPDVGAASAAVLDAMAGWRQVGLDDRPPGVGEAVDVRTLLVAGPPADAAPDVGPRTARAVAEELGIVEQVVDVTPLAAPQGLPARCVSVRLRVPLENR